ncbi:MAG: cystathionine beta-synthase [Alphaproteobacteria bacterium]|jgi:cystathionine beta-synthase|nr:cystathionine beta-synthase [Alphaproteobacteria bacterium]MEA2988055.1 cystathionine beta-synthase [Alphaproteobacteria bacterium]
MATVLDLIGETPLVEVTRIDRGPCRLFLKLESANPSGSLKDRPARAMIEAAEADGQLKPGGTIVEATAGNTGLGLALVGGRKGYRTLLVVPDKMAREKILHAQALGAQVITTRSDVGKGHPDYYQDLADAITRRTPGAIYVNQFANPANPRAHELSTGPEILRQMDGDIDAVVVGVGSGGMLTGIGRFMRQASPKTAMILADPVGSILAPLVETGNTIQAGSWAVEGIGEDFIPPNCDLSLVSKAYSIPDPESFSTARDLLRAEGILAGSSSGTLLAAALRYCRAQDKPQRVVTLVCDSGAKYLSKVFNPTFLAQEGWTHPERRGTVRDVVINRYSEGTAIVVRPDDNLRTVFSRMRSSGVSQLPVIDERGRVVGLVDESDVLASLITDPDGSNTVFARPVEDVMTTRLETISAEAPLAELVPLFRKDYTAIVMDGDQFVGVATRLDLINYFRITP